MAVEKIFDFNLLPQKSKKVVKEERKRDESTFYSVILLFSGIIIYLLLTLLDLILVQSRINTFEQTIAEYDQAIASYSDVRAKNGELFLKGERLSPVLENDIRLDTFLVIADQITGGIDIENYAREDSGAFIITFFVDSYPQALNIYDSASEQDGVEKPFIREISMNPNREDQLEVVLEFNIISDNANG